jgi:hypothetical protein
MSLGTAPAGTSAFFPASVWMMLMRAPAAAARTFQKLSSSMLPSRGTASSCGEVGLGCAMLRTPLACSFPPQKRHVAFGSLAGRGGGFGGSPPDNPRASEAARFRRRMSLLRCDPNLGPTPKRYSLLPP